MVIVIDLCFNCAQIMTNPICPECWSRHVLAWLNDKNLPEDKERKIKKEFKILIMYANETHSNTRCILCGKKQVSLCTYCFTNKATKILEKTTGPEIIENFERDFDTQILRKPPG